jgi:type IV pilus assembly protein PilB
MELEEQERKEREDSNKDKEMEVGQEEVDLLAMLTEAGIITIEQVREATQVLLKSQGERRLDEVLLEIGAIDITERDELIEFIYGMPYVDLNRYICDLEASKLVPREVAEKCNVIPLFMDENELTIAVGEPEISEPVECLRPFVNVPIRPVLADAEKIKEAIPRYYEAAETVDQAIEEVTKETTHVISSEVIPQGDAMESLREALKEVDISKELSKDASTIALINAILLLAVKNKATYLHIEPRKSMVKVRLRVRARMQDALDLPKNALTPLVKRLKTMANMDVAKVNRFQKGEFKVSIKDKDLNLKVSIVPTVYGERAVISGFKEKTVSIVFQSLGFSDEEMLLLNELLSKPVGLIVFGGSQQAVKTALSASAVFLNSSDKNIVIFDEALEEFNLPETNLVKYSSGLGSSYSESLKFLTSQDADVMILNRLSEPKTASVAMQIAISRHLVLGAAPGFTGFRLVNYLLDSGLDPNLISLSVSGLISQYWFKKLCSACCEEDKAALETKEVREFLEVDKTASSDAANDWFSGGSKRRKSHLKLCRPVGCAKCNQTGYSGKVLISEVIPVTPRLRRAIIERASKEELEELLAESDIESLKTKVLKEIFAGLIDVKSAMEAINGD